MRQRRKELGCVFFYDQSQGKERETGVGREGVAGKELCVCVCVCGEGEGGVVGGGGGGGGGLRNWYQQRYARICLHHIVLGSKKMAHIQIGNRPSELHSPHVFAN